MYKFICVRKGLFGIMFRLTKKKSSRSLYWTIIFIFILSVITAFIYYFVLVGELEDNANDMHVHNIEGEINSRLIGLELGLKQNRDLLKTIRFKLDKVFQELNGDALGETQEIDSISNVRNRSICYAHSTLKGIAINKGYNMI